MRVHQKNREKIRASDVVHADENSWKNDEVGHYVWFVGNKDLAFYHIDRHRSAKVAKNVFGGDFAGSLVRDGLFDITVHYPALRVSL